MLLLFFINLRGGASESEGEDGEGEIVTLGQDVPGHGNVKQQKSAVKLYEVRKRFVKYNNDMYLCNTVKVEYRTR